MRGWSTAACRGCSRRRGLPCNINLRNVHQRFLSVGLRLALFDCISCSGDVLHVEYGMWPATRTCKEDEVQWTELGPGHPGYVCPGRTECSEWPVLLLWMVQYSTVLYMYIQASSIGM